MGAIQVWARWGQILYLKLCLGEWRWARGVQMVCKRMRNLEVLEPPSMVNSFSKPIKYSPTLYTNLTFWYVRAFRPHLQMDYIALYWFVSSCLSICFSTSSSVCWLVTPAAIYTNISKTISTLSKYLLSVQAQHLFRLPSFKFSKIDYSNITFESNLVAI